MMILHDIRLKAIEISNTIRKVLGWPLIEVKPHHHHPHCHHHGKDEHKSQEAPGPIQVDGGFVSILPFPAPNHDVNGEWVPVRVSDAPLPPQHGATDLKEHGDNHPNRHRHWHGHRHRRSFLLRLHRSLMNLGRWEGRTVAFVIGKSIPIG